MIASTTHIRLLALSFEENSVHKQLFYNDTALHCGTDGLLVNKIAGTKDGRIFLVGDSELVHEVVYSSEKEYENSWTKVLGLSSRGSCRLVAHQHPAAWLRSIFGLWSVSTSDELVDFTIDHHRHLLYTISLDGVICGYKFGDNERDFRQFARVDNLEAKCRSFLGAEYPEERARNSEKDHVSLTWPLLRTHVLEPSESRQIHLIVVAESGARFFFKTGKRNSEFGSELSLCFMCFPPSYGVAVYSIDDNYYVYHNSSMSGGVMTTAYSHQTRNVVDDCVTTMTFDRRTAGEWVVDESSYDVNLSEDGTIYSLEAEPLAPSLLRNVAYLPSGAIALPDKETAQETVSSKDWGYRRSDRGAALNSLGDLLSVFARGTSDEHHRQEPSNDISEAGSDHVYDPPFGGVPRGLQCYYKLAMHRRMWSGSGKVGGEPPVLTILDTQHERGLAPTFLCLTRAGLRRLRYVCPIEQLLSILENEKDGRRYRRPERQQTISDELDLQENELEIFKKTFGEEETYAMLIAIGAHTVTASSGHDAQQLAKSELESSRINEVASCVEKGLSLYLWRLVRSIWKYPIFIHNSPGKSLWHVEFGFSEEELTFLREKLTGLKNFIAFMYKDINLIEKSKLCGQGFIVSVFALLNRICQALAIMKIFGKHCNHLGGYLSLLDRRSREKALSMTFKQMVLDSDGLVLVKFLVHHLIERVQNPKDESNIMSNDADVGMHTRDSKSDFLGEVQEILHHEAPYYFSREEFRMWKAFKTFDSARKSAVSTSISDRASKLQLSLFHAKNACKEWALQRCLPQLYDLCLGYAEFGFLNGVIDLCCTAAKEAAEGKLNVCAYGELSSVEEMETKGFEKIMRLPELGHRRVARSTVDMSTMELNSSQKKLYVRLACYAIMIKLVEETLKAPPESLVEQARAHEQMKRVPRKNDLGTILEGNAGMFCFKYLIERLLESDDFLLHEQLYKRLLYLEYTDILVHSDGKYLEDFLKRKRGRGESLFAYYKAHGRYSDAAYLQRERAEEDNSDGENDLRRKIHRLTGAIYAASEANTLSPGSIDQNTLNQWKRSLNLAEIQSEILYYVENLLEPESSARSTLNCRLLNANTLYHDYACKLKLHGPCLAILSLSNDSQSEKWIREVKKVWARVVAEEMEHHSFERVIPRLVRAIGDLGKRFWNETAEQALGLQLKDSRRSTSCIVPLLYLTDVVEKLCYEKLVPNLPETDYYPGWFSVNTLDRIGVPLALRYEVYRTIIFDKEGGEELHFIQAVSEFFDHATSETVTDRIYDFQRLCNRVIVDINARFLPKTIGSPLQETLEKIRRRIQNQKFARAH